MTPTPCSMTRIPSARFTAYATHLAHLRSLGADDVAHGERTLLQHLEGTFDILESWGCADYVCIAGMYHSVYGTNSFSSASISPDRRSLLRPVVGQRAERLVYLFSVIDKPVAIIKALSNDQGACTVKDRMTGVELLVTRRELRNLLIIECANLIEQRCTEGFLAVLVALPIVRLSALVGRSVAMSLKEMHITEAE
jgi:hypothetical protein